jgi:hypothetical protein
MFLFQLPYLPEMWMRLNDLNAIHLMYKDPQNPSKTIISADEIEAYKYIFSKPGKFSIGCFRYSVRSEIPFVPAIPLCLKKSYRLCSLPRG